MKMLILLILILFISCRPFNWIIPNKDDTIFIKISFEKENEFIPKQYRLTKENWGTKEKLFFCSAQDTIIIGYNKGKNYLTLLDHNGNICLNINKQFLETSPSMDSLFVFNNIYSKYIGNIIYKVTEEKVLYLNDTVESYLIFIDKKPFFSDEKYISEILITQNFTLIGFAIFDGLESIFYLDTNYKATRFW